MHHALLSLMLMAGACGEAPNRAIAEAPKVVCRCDVPTVLADLFAQATDSVRLRGTCDRAANDDAPTDKK